MNGPPALRIGNQTAFCAANLMEPFEYALANGFDAFEWFPDKKPSGAGWDETDLAPAMRADISQTARSAAVRLSVHARWTINPLLPDAALALRREIALAQDLGARVLVIHLYTEAGIAAYARAITPAIAWAAASGLQLAIENTVSTSPADFNFLFEELRKRDDSALAHCGMCLDIGHANLCTATRNDYLQFVAQLQPHVPIIHLHAHENWGDADSHLTLFTGPAAFTEDGVRGFLVEMKSRGFNGSLILEQWPQPPSLLKDARNRLLRMWNECNASAERGHSCPQQESKLNVTGTSSRRAWAFAHCCGLKVRAPP
ncbi:MAG: sugar phosphate isomerase/epimerase family protein, partial [Limisphaerales bacterium]